MTKVQVNLSLTEEVRDRLDALAMADRIATGSEMNRSLMVEALVNRASAGLKRIERAYDGKKLVGYNGFYGQHQVAYEEKTEAKAQAKIDQYAYEAAQLEGASK